MGEGGGVIAVFLRCMCGVVGGWVGGGTGLGRRLGCGGLRGKRGQIPVNKGWTAGAGGQG